MDIKKETEYRNQFKSILFDLAKSQEVLEDPSSRIDFYLRLEKLYYNTDFRHFYSDIFIVLTSVQQDISLGDINIIGQNLEIIRKGYQSVNTDSDGKPIDISRQINKLYDHVSLDIARITYSDAADLRVMQNENINNLKSDVYNLQEQINQSSQKIDNTYKDVRAAHRKVESAQKEYIAILGIFASIIITFIGGITFSSSVLQNIHSSSIYRIVLISLIIGMVLINVFYFLFYFIERIIRNKSNRKPILFFIINGILLTLMLITVFCWRIGIIENRNYSIENSYANSATQETTIDSVIQAQSTPSESKNQ